MMNLRIIKAVLFKQLKDTFKNKVVLVQFIMFPLLVIIMENAIDSPDIPKNYFVILFSTMYIGMAPLVSMASIISEEKENNTLRVLIMSNVKSMEYLVGVGLYVFVLCMLGSLAFGIQGGFQGRILVEYLGLMGVGILLSIVLGAAIGTWSKNQMAATSTTVPTMIILAFLPMISMFNEKVKVISKITYSQQIYDLINSLGDNNLGYESIMVICLNLLVLNIIFSYVYKKTNLC